VIRGMYITVKIRCDRSKAAANARLKYGRPRTELVRRAPVATPWPCGHWISILLGHALKDSERRLASGLRIVTVRTVKLKDDDLLIIGGVPVSFVVVEVPPGESGPTVSWLFRNRWAVWQ